MKHRGTETTGEKRRKNSLLLYLCTLCPLCVLCSPFLFAALAGQDHTRLDSYLDDTGTAQSIKSPRQWARRRVQILEGMQQAMGPLPDRSNLPPLDVKVSGEIKGDGFTRVALTFVSDGSDRVPADLYVPTSADKGKRLPAVLALHQTSPLGKRDLAGEGKNPNMGYAPELARHS